jgi:uncharacterized protein
LRTKMIVDAHVNITQDGKWFNTSYDSSLDRLNHEMDEAGIDKCLLISMPFASTNEHVASVVEKYPEKFRGLGQLDFKEKNPLGQVGEILSMGLSGIKIHPRMQGINLLDSCYSRLFEYFDERQSVLMIDGYYATTNDKLSLSDLEPFKYDVLAKRYPNIKFIISHIGGHRCFDLFFVAKSNMNVFIDNSHALKYFSGTSLIKDFVWIMDKLDEKMIYGSDFPEYGLKEYRNAFEQAVLGRKEVRTEMIYSNITKLVCFED